MKIRRQKHYADTKIAETLFFDSKKGFDKINII